jgi:hypothetical protein
MEELDLYKIPYEMVMDNHGGLGTLVFYFTNTLMMRRPLASGICCS